MISTKNETHKRLMDEFYSNPFYISYSGISKLIYSPVLFYRYYILKEREESLDSHLVEGKLTHCMLLDDGSFDQQFILMPSSIPTANTKKVIDKMFSLHQNSENKKEALDDYANDILEYLKEINLHQALKDDSKPDKNGKKVSGDQKRLEKLINDESKNYWEFLKVKGNKTLIDESMMETARESVDVLRNNTQVQDLLGIFKDETKNIDVINEIYIKADLLDYPFGLHGIIDSLKVDHDLKVIYVNDLKKTNRSLVDFKETVEVYNYWIQCAIYHRLVFEKFSKLIIDNGYEVVFNFVVIDKYNQVYSFEVSKETMVSWQERLEEKLQWVKWHYENKKYNLPYELAKGIMKL